MNINLDNRIALVTGASRGIGKAIASSLGQSGALVIGTATSESGVEKIRKDLKAKNIKGLAHVLDVSNMDSVNVLFDFLTAVGLASWMLGNNAGSTRDNLFLRMKEDEWEDVINTNLNSIYRVTKACIKAMMKARFGRIINITSVVALSGNAGQVNYTAAKAGIIGFTRSLAKEIGTRGITVNAIAPGFIMTDMTDGLTEEQKSDMTKQIALGRLGDVDEVADTVTFLASDAAGYITGETINVNGGLYMA